MNMLLRTLFVCFILGGVLAACESNASEEPNTPDSPEKPASTDTATTKYRGSYFDVRYPATFAARPDTPRGTEEFAHMIYTDEAFFTSPDGAVEFFVFSPIWSGEPENYMLVWDNETLVSDTSSESQHDQMGATITRWVTVEDKAGKYTRSFVSKREQVGTGSDVHHVFGIRYRDQAAYDKYKDAYLRFKKSLMQYAD